jgi:hypothetical protein
LAEKVALEGRYNWNSATPGGAPAVGGGEILKPFVSSLMNFYYSHKIEAVTNTASITNAYSTTCSY